MFADIFSQVVNMSLLCKSFLSLILLLWHHNVECRYYALFIVFWNISFY